MPALSPTTTTLTNQVAGDQTRLLTLGSVTGIVADSLLVLGKEIVQVKSVNSTTLQVTVKRGFGGSAVSAHRAGARVYVFQASTQPQVGFDKGTNRVVVNGYTGYLGPMALPVGSLWMDEDGNEYILADAGAAHAVGDWVVLDGSGVTAALSTTSKGRVGIVVETVDASDNLCWILRRGQTTSAKHTTGVTTGCVLIAGASTVDISTSTGGNVVFNATITTLGTSSNDLGTAYIDNPWCYGLTTDIIP